MFLLHTDDTIVAVSSPPGIGGIAVIRCSGKDALPIVQKIFYKKNHINFNWENLTHHKMYYGEIWEDRQLIDEVMLCYFKSPHSYTGEDLIEIYCHGSVFIQQKLVQLFINNGARPANAGEFTIRAYLNGKMNLSDAEAIGDLIHAETESAHLLSIQQLRGGYKNIINGLKENILNFLSLLELELDFSEEDVEFANRSQLKEMLRSTIKQTEELMDSFQYGNAIKTGVPVVILGKPNAGKSTLLNALLNEEKAIVSEIPGTTRDLIEDKLNIKGILFRIIDTAGIRDAKDEIEKIGIEKAKESIKKSMIVILLIDINEPVHQISEYYEWIKTLHPSASVITVFNKCDTIVEIKNKIQNALYISAKNKNNIDLLKEKLYETFISKNDKNIARISVSNVRHYNELKQAKHFLEKAEQSLNDNAHTEIIAEELKFAVHYLSNITGNITSEDILSNIFSKFCIGK